VTAHAPAAAILATQDETIAIVAERRLAVAALTALLLKEPGYRLVAEARGSIEVRDAVDVHRPSVLVEARNDSLPLSPCGGGSSWGVHPHITLVVGPQDRAFDFVATVRAAINQARAVPMHSQDRRLSGREQEILTQIANGKSTKEVARACAITPKTVGNHVSNIRHKFHLHHRGQLVLFAVEQGLIAL